MNDDDDKILNTKVQKKFFKVKSKNKILKNENKRLCATVIENVQGNKARKGF
jgi:hypothetical protein